MLDALKPFMISLQSILQLDCLSAGLLDFYTKWVIRVFVIPALMLGLVGLQYCFERRRVGHSMAAGYFKANAFVVVFLCCEPATLPLRLSGLSRSRVCPVCLQILACVIRPLGCSLAGRWVRTSACW